jgi:hypothetical protein
MTELGTPTVCPMVGIPTDTQDRLKVEVVTEVMEVRGPDFPGLMVVVIGDHPIFHGRCLRTAPFLLIVFYLLLNVRLYLYLRR